MVNFYKFTIEVVKQTNHFLIFTEMTFDPFF